MLTTSVQIDGIERPLQRLGLESVGVLLKFAANLGIDCTRYRDESTRYVRYHLITELRDKGVAFVAVQFIYERRVWIHHAIGKQVRGERSILASIEWERGVRPEGSLTR